MEEERQRDFRVPIISGLFFISCLTGGILLVMWLFEINGSHPWFPILALILIGFPWIFWFLTYIYTLIKPCVRHSGGGGELSQKPSAATASATSARVSPLNSPTGKRHVQFGAVVVMDSNGGSSRNSGHEDGSAAGDVSVASSKECEMPLTRGAVSS